MTTLDGINEYELKRLEQFVIDIKRLPTPAACLRVRDHERAVEVQSRSWERFSIEERQKADEREVFRNGWPKPLVRQEAPRPIEVPYSTELEPTEMKVAIFTPVEMKQEVGRIPFYWYTWRLYGSRKPPEELQRRFQREMSRR